VLHLVDSARLSYYPGALTGRGWLVFILDGRALFARTRKLHKREYAAMAHHQQALPLYIMTVRGLNYWLFRDHFYCSSDWLEPADVVGVLEPHAPRVPADGHDEHRIA
jgi:hypothetical protein